MKSHIFLKNLLLSFKGFSEETSTLLTELHFSMSTTWQWDCQRDILVRWGILQKHRASAGCYPWNC